MDGNTSSYRWIRNTTFCRRFLAHLPFRYTHVQMQPVVIMRGWTVVVLALFVSVMVAVLICAISLFVLRFYTALPFEAGVIVSIAFACIFWIWLLRHLSPTKPALVIDDRGIVDNASDYEVSLIPWSEITGATIAFRYTRGFGLGPGKVLAISVRDLESLTARVRIIPRTLMRLNKRLSGSVIEIPQTTLRTLVEEVLSSIQQHCRPALRSSMAAEPERNNTLQLKPVPRRYEPYRDVTSIVSAVGITRSKLIPELIPPARI
jgi:hypothetical protein